MVYFGLINTGDAVGFRFCCPRTETTTSSMLLASFGNTSTLSFDDAYRIFLPAFGLAFTSNISSILASTIALAGSSGRIALTSVLIFS